MTSAAVKKHVTTNTCGRFNITQDVLSQIWRSVAATRFALCMRVIWAQWKASWLFHSPVYNPILRPLDFVRSCKLVRNIEMRPRSCHKYARFSLLHPIPLIFSDQEVYQNHPRIIIHGLANQPYTRATILAQFVADVHTLHTAPIVVWIQGLASMDTASPWYIRTVASWILHLICKEFRSKQCCINCII